MGVFLLLNILNLKFVTSYQSSPTLLGYFVIIATMLTYDQSPTSFYGSSRSAVPVSKPYVPNLKPRYRHLFIVTGPAGSGKSTVAKYLADSFKFPYIEGDEVSLIK